MSLFIEDGTPSRRRLLAGVGSVTIPCLAGCTTDTTDDSGQSRSTTPTGSADDTELDLREANVVAVAVEATEDAYRFDVTLYHDDDGEDGYANWWQVETLSGDRLGRRDLLHSHGTRRFTRSETIEIPADITCVAVRGHDQTHGYGGRAMLVEPDTGETRSLDQGSDRDSMSDLEC